MKLASNESQQAMEILGQELEENRATRRQERAYKALNWAVVVCFVSLAIAPPLLFAPELGWTSNESLASTAETGGAILMTVSALSMLAMIPLFVLNLGLIRKLWRNARMRKRLGLSRPLEGAFKAQRRAHWVRNLLTRGLVGLGVLFAATALVPLAKADAKLDAPLLVPVASFILGLSFVSLHFIRRGIERQAIVQNLYELLRRQSSAGQMETGETRISDAQYDMIAKIERNQIIKRRKESLQADKHSDAFGYAVRVSFAAQDAKDTLTEHDNALVDAQIVRLASDPECEADREGSDDQTGLRQLPVEGTSVTIHWRADPEARRIQIVRISSAADDANAFGGGSRDARQ